MSRGTAEAQGPWLLTGAGGVLGLGLAAAPAPAPLVLAGRQPPPFWAGTPFLRADLEHPGALRAALLEARPRAVLHAAAWSRIEACEEDPQGAWRANVAAVEEVLEGCALLGASLVYVSTDQVFDGRDGWLDEGHGTAPLHAYGRTKAEAESRVLAFSEDGAQRGAVLGCVVRLPLLLGPAAGQGRCGADTALLEELAAGRRPCLFHDELRTPVAATLLAAPLWALLARPRSGVFHLAGSEVVSRYELGSRVCAAAGVDPAFDGGSVAGVLPPERAAQRPRSLQLRCRRARKELGWKAPDLRQSLAHLGPAAGASRRPAAPADP